MQNIAATAISEFNEPVLTEAASHIGVQVDRLSVIRRHSKEGEFAYDNKQRKKDFETLNANIGNEVDAGVTWAISQGYV